MRRDQGVNVLLTSIDNVVFKKQYLRPISDNHYLRTVVVDQEQICTILYIIYSTVVCDISLKNCSNRFSHFSFCIHIKTYDDTLSLISAGFVRGLENLKRA